LKDLINYPQENIKQELIDKITPVLEKDNFQSARLINVSPVADSLAKWCHAQAKLFNVNLIVTPKKL
jgi:hypothetical protein